MYFWRNGMSEIEIKKLRVEGFEVIQKLSERKIDPENSEF